jgi:hypothetical protein
MDGCFAWSLLLLQIMLRNVTVVTTLVGFEDITAVAMKSSVFRVFNAV